LADPTFLIAILAFLLSLITIALVDRRRDRLYPVVDAAAARGE
jgi:hypothetical protein